MDICFINSDRRTNIRPTTIHGMLWLQTHFESHQWDALASLQVMLSKNDAEMLANDATEAGLRLNSVPSILYSNKY